MLTGAANYFLHLHRIRLGVHRRRGMRPPARDMPIGILATLAICAVLYGGVALVLTGIVNWKTLDNAAPVANALKSLGMNRIRLIVTTGALLGMLSSLLVFQYGQARIWFAMSRDRLLPGLFSRIHPKFRHRTSALGSPDSQSEFPRASGKSAPSPISQHRHALRVHLGFAGVIVLRRASPAQAQLPRPVGPAAARDLDPLLLRPDAEPATRTWIRFFVWLVIGLVITSRTASPSQPARRAPLTTSSRSPRRATVSASPAPACSSEEARRKTRARGRFRRGVVRKLIVRISASCARTLRTSA